MAYKLHDAVQNINSLVVASTKTQSL